MFSLLVGIILVLIGAGLVVTAIYKMAKVFTKNK
jgi:hypothetical protein